MKWSPSETEQPQISKSAAILFYLVTVYTVARDYTTIRKH